jgi:sporulation protein YlmC with PRC-barrel domain
MKFSTLCTAAALACAITAPVYAQGLTPGSTQAMAEHSLRASKLVGTSVFNEQDQNIGSIVEIMVDDKTGMATAILSVGNFVGGGQKMVEVPITHIKLMGTSAMMAGATKQMLAAMPSYNNIGLQGGGG